MGTEKFAALTASSWASVAFWPGSGTEEGIAGSCVGGIPAEEIKE